MGPTTWSCGTTQPLLLELARALRARTSLSGTPGNGSQPCVRYAARVWASAVAHAPPLDLEVRDTSFALDGEEALGGPGLSRLAHTLHQLGVRSLHVDPELEPRELEAFIDRAAQGMSGAALVEALHAAQVAHLSVSLAPEPEHPGDARSAARPGRFLARMAEAVTPREPPVLPCSSATETLLEQLAELELCSEAASYARALEQIDQTLGQPVGAGTADAYRAAVVLGRHASHGGGRDSEIRRLARSRACDLVLEGAGLLELVLQQAHSGAAASARPAVHLLTTLGAEVMPLLLDAYARAPSDLSEHTPEVLLAMGEHLVPAVAGELSSSSPARARRGAELMGVTQHPRGVAFLTEQLAHPDPGVRREVARALARIGTRRAVRVLIEALHGEPSVAEFAALGLGESASQPAQSALVEVAENEQAPQALRGHAIRALGRLGDPASIPLLESVLGTRRLLRAWRQRPLRLLAAEALARVGGERARVALEAFADDGDRAVRAACREGLRSLRS